MNWLNTGRTEAKKVISSTEKINKRCLFPAFSKINTEGTRWHQSVSSSTQIKGIISHAEGKQTVEATVPEQSRCQGCRWIQTRIRKIEEKSIKDYVSQRGMLFRKPWTSHCEGLKQYPESSTWEFCLLFRIFHKYLPFSWALFQKRQSLGSDPAATGFTTLTSSFCVQILKKSVYAKSLGRNSTKDLMLPTRFVFIYSGHKVWSIICYKRKACSLNFYFSAVFQAFQK